MPTPSDIVSQMRTSLSISEPDLDTSIGTPIRKILDVVGEAIAEAYIDSYLTSYQYDIDARSGSDLDSFVSLFGFSRQQARRSTGTVVLQRNSPAESAFLIPVGTQFATSTSPVYVVQTLSANVFPQGATSISVTVQASVAGATGNITANSLTRSVTSLSGITALTNPAPLSGGSDAESDEQLRDRFKKSVFRNLSGTEDMFLGVALDDEDTIAATVIGPSENWTEQIEMVSGVATSIAAPVLAKYKLQNVNSVVTGTVNLVTADHVLSVGDTVRIYGITSTNSSDVLPNGSWIIRDVGGGAGTEADIYLQSLDGETVWYETLAGTIGVADAYLEKLDRIKYIYPSGYAFGADLKGGDFLTPNVHYQFDYTAVPPTVTSLDSDNCPDGIYELSFNYVPQSSRSNPPQGISNTVDIYVSGQRSVQGTEIAIIDGRVVAELPSETNSYKNFTRNDGSFAEAGNAIARLSFQPTINLPSTLTVHSSTLQLNTDYWAVSDRTVTSGAWDSFGGIEFSASSLPLSAEISSSTNASPIVITTNASHTFLTGMRVLVENHDNTGANGIFTVQAVTSTTITLADSTGTGTGTATGNVYLYQPVTVQYDYNEIPRDVQSEAESWRMITTDVMVHYGNPILLKMNLAVILRPGYSLSSVQSAVENSINTYLDSLEFGGQAQISDLLNVIGDVTGIDAVRILSSRDVDSLPISSVDGNTSSLLNTGTIDITFSSAHGLSEGDTVYVSEALFNYNAGGSYYPIDGAWVVESVPDSVTIRMSGDIGIYGYLSGGTVYTEDFGIQRMNIDGSPSKVLYVTEDAPHRATDILSNGREFFDLHSVVMTVKAANTWGSA